MLRKLQYFFFGATPADKIDFEGVEPLRKELLPELWQEIYSHLDLPSLTSAALVSKASYLTARSNAVNAKKLKVHFPFLYEENPISNDYHGLFVTAYKTSYSKLTPLQKKWMSSIKENDIPEMRSLAIQDAFIILRDNICRCHRWLTQETRDYLFTSIFLNCYNRNIIYDDNDELSGLSMLHWLAILDPSEVLSNNLMPNWILKNNCCAKGYTPLSHAASFGRLNACRQFADRGVDIKSGGSGIKASPFYRAAQNGHVAVLSFLYERGADIDEPRFNGYTPLYVAAKMGRLEAVIFLLQHDANVNDHDNSDHSAPLYIAAQNGFWDIVEELLAYGAAADIDTFLEGYTPLYVAAQNGHQDAVEIIANQDVAINRRSPNGSTPLYVACQNGHANIAAYLIARGAEVEIFYAGSYTPLYTATQRGHLEVIKVLLPHVKNINIQTELGATALYVACMQGYTEIVTYLLDHLADPAIRFRNGYTSLHIAVRENKLDIVILLVERYPHLLDMLDAKDKSPLDIAIEENYSQIKKVLAEKYAFYQTIDESTKIVLR